VPRTETAADISSSWRLHRITNYWSPGSAQRITKAKRKTKWLNGSYASAWSGVNSGILPHYWRAPHQPLVSGYTNYIGTIDTGWDRSGNNVTVSIRSEDYFVSFLVSVSAQGTNNSNVEYLKSQADIPGLLYEGPGTAGGNITLDNSLMVPGTGSSARFAPYSGLEAEQMFATVGPALFDGATTQQITLPGTSTVAAGDSLVVVGPNKAGTICTLTIAFASGTSGTTYPVAVTQPTSTSVTATVYLGGCTYATNTQLASVIEAAFTAAVWYIKDPTHGNAANDLYEDCGPDCCVFKQQDNQGILFINHPDPRTTLTSTSYVQVNGTWTDRTDGVQTQWNNSSSTPTMRLTTSPGITEPSVAWGYDFGDVGRTKFITYEGEVDELGNVYVNTQDTSTLPGKMAVVVPYEYATTATAWVFDTPVHQNSVVGAFQTYNFLPSRFGSDFSVEIGITNELVGGDCTYRLLDYDGGLITTSRNVAIVAVAGDTLYKHDTSGWSAVSGGGAFSTLGRVSSATGFEKAYFTDAVKYWVYDPKQPGAGLVTELTATAGAIPKYCLLVAYWRDRLVVAREATYPGRWHMSKVGDPTNWDFVPVVATVTDAVSSQTSQAGQVPDVINAVIPWTDDILLFGGDSSIWQLTGDPLAANSFFDMISDATGIAFGQAWCKDPEGNLWFFGSDGGLFFMSRQSRPVRVSLNKVEYQLRKIDLTAYEVRLAWNSVDEGVHIFQVPKGGGGPIVDHWFYEAPTQAWHKDRFGLASTDLIQPTAIARSNGDLPQDRVLLVGCEDGRLRALPESVENVGRSDEKTNSSTVAIDSYVTMGPLVDNPYTGAAMVTEFGAVLSPSGDSANFEFFATDEPENLGEAVARGTLAPGRNDRKLIRVSGDHLFMRIRNATKGQTWSWEGGYAKQDYGGDLRR
jgi:hypothetical protein